MDHCHLIGFKVNISFNSIVSSKLNWPNSDYTATMTQGQNIGLYQEPVGL